MGGFVPMYRDDLQAGAVGKSLAVGSAGWLPW
jgi:hypothetical protein